MRGIKERGRPGTPAQGQPGEGRGGLTQGSTGTLRLQTAAGRPREMSRRQLESSEPGTPGGAEPRDQMESPMRGAEHGHTPASRGPATKEEPPGDPGGRMEARKRSQGEKGSEEEAVAGSGLEPSVLLSASGRRPDLPPQEVCQADRGLQGCPPGR